jgi:hypothetical protein
MAVIILEKKDVFSHNVRHEEKNLETNENRH